MAYAVSVFFDEVTDAAVRQIWQKMEDSAVSSLLSCGLYRPHLKLGIYGQLDVLSFQEALESLASAQPVLTTVLPNIGVFPATVSDGTTSVFLAATLTQDLMALHCEVHARLARFGSNPHPFYLPDRWNPHCTVAMSIAESLGPKAVALCQSELAHLPLETRIEQIGVVETPVEKELYILDFMGEA